MVKEECAAVYWVSHKTDETQWNKPVTQTCKADLKQNELLQWENDDV